MYRNERTYSQCLNWLTKCWHWPKSIRFDPLKVWVTYKKKLRIVIAIIYPDLVSGPYPNSSLDLS